MSEVTQVAEAIKKGHAVIADAEIIKEAVERGTEEAIDGIVEVVEVFRTNPKIVAAGVGVGVVAGLVGGYFLGKKMLEDHYAELAELEIAQAKVFYAAQYKLNADGTPLTPQDVLTERHGAEAMEALRTYAGDEEPPNEGTPADEAMDEAQIASLEERAGIQREGAPYREAFKGSTNPDTEAVKTELNVFQDDTFDLEEEVKYRTEDKPFIITHDEYFENAHDYENYSYTWYTVDEVLCDEHDKPVEDTDEVVGDEHLARFGSGSKDPNIVYIRNDRMGIDMEVVRSKGSYLEEVLGIPKEDEKSMKHSDAGDRRRAMRTSD